MINSLKRAGALLLIIAILSSCAGNTKKEERSKAAGADGSVKKNVVKNGALRYLEEETDMATLLAQGWEMEDDVEALNDMPANSGMEIPFRSYYMFPDGSYTKNPRNAMEYGQWKFDDERKTISFVSQEEGTGIYRIMALAPDELKLKNIGINTQTILKFVSAATVFNNPLKDPYHISNNRWRIKPGHPETDAEIAARVKGNFHFFELFYEDAIIKQVKKVSFYGFPSALKWYAGGIYLQKKEDLGDAWARCFYDDQQALKGYELVSKVLDRKYKWPGNKQLGWLEKNLFVLKQMTAAVDSIK